MARALSQSALRRKADTNQDAPLGAPSPRFCEGLENEGLTRADIKNRAGGALANRAEAHAKAGLFEILNQGRRSVRHA